MSIDQNKKVARDFMDLLKIRDFTFHNFSTEHFINLLFESVSEIWKLDQSPNYTIHDTEHSFRICEFFNHFDTAYDWSNYEKLVFLTASLIHDIGMQYNSWGSTVMPIINKKVEFQRLDIETQRKHHVDSYFQMVNFFILNAQKKVLWATPPAFCDPQNTTHTTILREALTIACAHSTDSSGKESHMEKLGGASFPSTGRDTNGGKYRGKLLGMILKLCDELDGNYNRVKDPRRFTASDIDSENKKHWVANLLIQSIDVIVSHSPSLSNGKSLEIKLNWQIPENSPSTLKKNIRHIIEKFRVAKLNETIAIAKEFLSKLDQAHLWQPISVEPLGNTPYSFTFDKGKLAPIITKIIDSLNPIQPAKRPKSTNKVKFQNSLPITTNSLTDRLQDWFYENKREEHILLSGGLHTDTYLHCRNLVSDYSLVHEASSTIFEHFDALGKKIECVIGVGTSAIPIAVALATRFKCAVTFIVSPITSNTATSKNKGRDHNVLAESRLDFFNKRCILVVDDVIASGKVASEVIHKIIKATPAAQVASLDISHAAIFRLGNLEIAFEKDFPIKNIQSYYVTHIPEVRYFAVSSKKHFDPDNCDICKELNRPACEEIDVV